MVFENLFIRTKRTIGSVELDSVILEEHKGSVTITKNPVEAGADITDHAIVQPDVVNIQGIITDTPLGSAAIGQIVNSITNLFGTSNDSNLTRSQQAYKALEELKNQAEPIQVDTKLKTYDNMLITSISTSQDKDSSRAVIVNLTLEEIILTVSETIRLSESDLFPSIAKSASSTIEKGKQELSELSETTNTSVLSSISSWFGG